jgi:hypothetical protein
LAGRANPRLRRLEALSQALTRPPAHRHARQRDAPRTARPEASRTWVARLPFESPKQPPPEFEPDSREAGRMGLWRRTGHGDPAPRVGPESRPRSMACTRCPPCTRRPCFFPLSPRTDDRIVTVLQRVHASVQTLLRRRGRLPNEPSPSDPVAEQMPLLAAHAAAAIPKRVAAGPRAALAVRRAAEQCALSHALAQAASSTASTFTGSSRRAPARGAGA